MAQGREQTLPALAEAERHPRRNLACTNPSCPSADQWKLHHPMGAESASMPMGKGASRNRRLSGESMSRSLIRPFAPLRSNQTPREASPLGPVAAAADAPDLRPPPTRNASAGVRSHRFAPSSPSLGLSLRHASADPRKA
jgi:hypothetical protein